MFFYRYVVSIVNNNQKMYQIIIKKWATVTYKNIKILERGKGYFPLFIFLFRYNSILILIHLFFV